MNLRTGMITIKAGEEDIPHQVCLGFVISMLFLLVQPRPPIIMVRLYFIIENEN